jgi:ADP-ribose pyrophosphatase YjhB (NUDIX family)
MNPPGESSTRVVTCFLESDGKILILLRSEKVGTYRGKWGGVAGFIESTPEQQSLTEIREETGLEAADVSLVKQGDFLTVSDNNLGREWIVYPFLFHVTNASKIKIDWEHREMKWIDPRKLGQFDTVPGLIEAYRKVN